MHLLIIEDEAKLGDYLRKGFMESGFIVDLARDGGTGLNLACNGRYDAIVLDVMLPVLDGFQVLGSIRRASMTPVLMLTARDDVADRVRGLETGADDYRSKVKPCKSRLRDRSPSCLPRCAQNGRPGCAARQRCGPEPDVSSLAAAHWQLRRDLA